MISNLKKIDDFFKALDSIKEFTKESNSKNLNWLKLYIVKAKELQKEVNKLIEEIYNEYGIYVDAINSEGEAIKLKTSTLERLAQELDHLDKRSSPNLIKRR